MASELSQSDLDRDAVSDLDAAAHPALDRRDDRATASRPRIRRGAKALVARSERVLLVEERREDGSTFWSLPGGGVDGEESLRGCLRRELSEELDCRIAVDRPVRTCTYRHTSMEDTVTVYTVFEGELRSTPDPVDTEGVVDCAWIDPSDPPDGTLAPFERLLADLRTADLSR